MVKDALLFIMMLRKSLLAQTHASLSFTLFNPSSLTSFYITSSHLLHLSVQLRQVEMVLPVSHLHYRFCLFKQTNNATISATMCASHGGVILGNDVWREFSRRVIDPEVTVLDVNKAHALY